MASDRINITVNDLNFTPANNLVLCKVDVVTGKSKSGLYVADEGFNPASCVTRFGEVVLLPKGLIFHTGKRKGIEWETDLEARVGDMAYWGVMEGANCPIIRYNGEVYFLVDYGEIRVLRRGGEIIPVNGFVLLEEVKEKSSSVVLTPFLKTDKKKGIIKYVGKRNRKYINTELSDPLNLSVGDEVLFRIKALTELEDDRFSDELKGLFYCQQKWIICKI